MREYGPFHAAQPPLPPPRTSAIASEQATSSYALPGRAVRAPSPGGGAAGASKCGNRATELHACGKLRASYARAVMPARSRSPWQVHDSVDHSSPMYTGMIPMSLPGAIPRGMAGVRVMARPAWHGHGRGISMPRQAFGNCKWQNLRRSAARVLGARTRVHPTGYFSSTGSLSKWAIMAAAATQPASARARRNHSCRLTPGQGETPPCMRAIVRARHHHAPSSPSCTMAMVPRQ